MNSNSAIIELYDITTKDYIEAWSNTDDLGMHFGLWDKKTKNRHDAIRNENHLVATYANIKRGDHVLDAGCGIGGTSIWLSKQLGAIMYGITLSKHQVKLAIKFASQHHVDNIFYDAQDFTNTRFLDNSFDSVIAIESSCHADKKKFIDEAYRVLKPDGTLVIVDYYRHATKRLNWPIQRLFMRLWLNGWKMIPFPFDSSIKKVMVKSGFLDVKIFNATGMMLPSSLRLFAMCLIALVPDVFAAFIRRGDFRIELGNTIASIAQYYLFRYNHVKYMVCVARKH